LLLSRFAFLTPEDIALGDESVAELPCSYRDALKLAQQIKDPILIAQRGPFGTASYIALANIEQVPVVDNSASLRLGEIYHFFRPVPVASELPDTTQLINLAIHDFEWIIRQASGANSWEESPTPSTIAVPRELFTQQLSAQQREICAFSGTRTSDGMAFIIRPLDQGGAWHIDNFLFLDVEPGELFAAFAWTIGPQLQIIIDTHAVTRGMTEAFNQTGMLAISDKAITTLDRTALAWHRERFFARLHG